VQQVEVTRQAPAPLADRDAHHLVGDGIAALAVDDPRGCAQVTCGRRGWTVEAEGPPEALDRLLPVALDLVADEGGGDVQLWVSHAGAGHDAVAAEHGLHPDRDLYQMRIPLPRHEPATLATRSFVPGQDEAAWVEVNNRAFHWHPEQGGWDVDTVRAREAEAWFDPEGLLLHEIDGRLAGFCWTKVHADSEPPLGEIYVIATDPDFHGQGLGRGLVLAGLDHLYRRHGLHTGMLYVDASNQPAVHLYQAMGFTVDHVHRSYLAQSG
jgi:mycothiol synthase